MVAVEMEMAIAAVIVVEIDKSRKRWSDIEYKGLVVYVPCIPWQVKIKGCIRF